MIALSHVTKRYPGGYEALRDVSMTIEEGQLVAITGHSGAGKSTLLKLVAAVEKPTSGSVVVAGQNVATLPARALPFLRRRFGMVFQDHKLLYDRDAFENVALSLRITGFDRGEISNRVHAALDKVGLLDRKHAMPITLSGGEQQRLCIARAIVHRPAMLLADEPTANLDADYAREIAELLLSFNRVGVTVIVATHDIALIERTVPRVLKLDHGRLREA